MPTMFLYLYLQHSLGRSGNAIQTRYSGFSSSQESGSSTSSNTRCRYWRGVCRSTGAIHIPTGFPLPNAAIPQFGPTPSLQIELTYNSISDRGCVRQKHDIHGRLGVSRCGQPTRTEDVPPRAQNSALSKTLWNFQVLRLLTFCFQTFKRSKSGCDPDLSRFLYFIC